MLPRYVHDTYQVLMVTTVLWWWARAAPEAPAAQLSVRKGEWDDDKTLMKAAVDEMRGHRSVTGDSGAICITSCVTSKPRSVFYLKER